MKLRTKFEDDDFKLGEVVVADIVSPYTEDELKICCRAEAGGLHTLIYHSIAEMLEDWEDYIPKETLIKDEKIISLLRPWIKFNKIEKAIIFKTVSETRGLEDSWFHIKGQDCNGCWWDIEIHASYSESVDKDYHGELVDIEELCGSEEWEDVKDGHEEHEEDIA